LAPGVSHRATASVALMAGDRAVGAGAAASLHFMQFPGKNKSGNPYWKSNNLIQINVIVR
jgi:hypothetical protein